MKKALKIYITIVMALITAATVPMQIFATSKPVYVSEMVIESGSSENEAKAKLTEAGYTVLDSNISNSANGKDTSGYMYIGYKTTDNSDEAITDIRLMHMGGGYSYAEYEQLIEQKTLEIGQMTAKLALAVTEYRENYKNGQKSAKLAYEMLNKLKEDDSGLLLGDYFLDTSKTQNDYTKVFMQSSTAVLITVEKALAIACSVSSSEFLSNVAERDPEDYIGEVQYEAIASDIYESVAYFQNTLEIYENSGLKTQDNPTDEQLKEAFDSLTDEEAVDWNRSFTLAYLLESIELYDGSNLYDLFMSDPDELTTQDFYVLASALSDGQAAMIEVAGLDTVLTAAVLTEEQWAETSEFSFKVDEPISVYTGVDRSLFEGGVALTNKAMVEAAANTEKAWYASLSTDSVMFDVLCISALTLVGAAAVYAAATIASKVASSIIVATGRRVIAEQVRLITVKGLLVRCNFVMKFCRYLTTGLTYVMIVALGVLLIATAIYLISAGLEYYNPTYDEIPRILVEKNTDKSDETVYTYYYSVKNTEGKIVDINQHDASRWMTFYTTEDKQAGTPILAVFDIKETNIQSGYVGVRKFSQDTAFNLNKFSYNLNSDVSRDGNNVKIKDAYLFYKQEAEPNNYASVITGENTLFGVAGLAVGLAVGIVGTAIFFKKKRNTEPAESK